MALKVINKFNTRLRFLHRSNDIFTPSLVGLLCKALMQLHLNYAWSVWYPNLTKDIKQKLQVTQN